MVRVACLASTEPVSDELVASLRAQNFLIFSVLGFDVDFVLEDCFGSGYPRDWITLEHVVDQAELVVLMAVGRGDVQPTLNPIEQGFYALMRRCASDYVNSIVIVQRIDLESFESMHGEVGNLDVVARRDLAIKTFAFTSERDRSMEMVLKETAFSLPTPPPVQVLLIGSGAREHALAVALAKSPKVDIIHVAPGNGGTADDNKIRNVSNLIVSEADDYHKEIVAFAKENDISLVVVGPEQPLVDGLVDLLEEAGVLTFGPTKRAAQLEGSKAFSKAFFHRHDLPSAEYRTFTDFEQARAYIEEVPHRVVVKASGVAAGKGVLLPNNTEEAVEAARQVLVHHAFGAAACAECVVEQFLQGEECSVMSFCDGKCSVAMPAAQDYKRAGDGDQGGNTGGMGAICPAPSMAPAMQAQMHDILQRTVDAMASEGNHFKGCLYGGFILTAQGPMLLEYNCRFGDPETQVLLSLLESDLYEVMQACAGGNLNEIQVSWSDDYACTVVCAAPGYPGQCPTGLSISGIDAANRLTGVQVYHAGTTRLGDDLVTSGGRVISVTGTGRDANEARAAAYLGVECVSFEGHQYRTDIGHPTSAAAAAVVVKAEKSPLVRVGVLGSTRGSSLQPVLDAIEAGRCANATVVVVISDKEDAEILARASRHGIPAVHIPVETTDAKRKRRTDYDQEVSQVLSENGVDLVLMIGYMRIVSVAFIKDWHRRALNVHPSLLPEFAGGMDLTVHEAVLAAGKKESGCTIHYVTEAVDGGPIVLQSTCAVEEGDSPASLKTRVQALEGEAFIQAINMYHQGIIGPNSESSGPPSSSSSSSHGGIQTLTYADAGVDIDAGESLVQRIKPLCKGTRRAGCDATLGGFGGLFNLAQAGYDASETVLVSGTDGVGTKLKIAQSVGVHNTIGIDLVAMCVNDILVCGAEPLFFLDYYACGRLDVEAAAQVVEGIAKGCLESGCALIGGETAEMSGMYKDGEYDLAGFSVGAVKRSDVLPRDICSGDILIALPSSGVHSNGYSLVRKCVERSGLDWNDPPPFDVDGSDTNGTSSYTLADALLLPTRLYVQPLLPLIQQGLVKGMAHITGGGLTDNIPRVLPDDIAAIIDFKTADFELPPVFRWLQQQANLPDADMLRTFNCGIGMIVVVDASDKDAVMDQLKETAPGAVEIGRLVERGSLPSPVFVVGFPSAL
jgi:phosphoribosylamine--glycine ligase/phosphoribosylglycinamide formyltransferase/phosphoribosylformylglycinamidine cyclo-ligase/phosphoribosylamine--glycine ligase/phosphoribosylformylglycinamidine cyclo-ligase